MCYRNSNSGVVGSLVSYLMKQIPMFSRAFSPRPKSGASAKIVEKPVPFFNREKRPSADHVYHAFHHNFTTKTPRSAPIFSQKPCKNHSYVPAKKTAKSSTALQEAHSRFLQSSGLLLGRLLDVEVDAHCVLNAIACRGDCDRVDVIKISGAATRKRADGP